MALKNVVELKCFVVFFVLILEATAESNGIAVVTIRLQYTSR